MPTVNRAAPMLAGALLAVALILAAPHAPARNTNSSLLLASRFMDRNASAGARDRMVMLLADGQNDCGDVGQAMAALQASGTIFRHETVGFGITPNSAAADDLREIATRTGGAYHHAADAAQLADVFMAFVDTFSVIDLLGQFGSNAPAPSRPDAKKADAPKPDKDDGLTGLLGSFTAPSDSAPTPPSSPTSRGPAAGEQPYLAVATSPPAGWNIKPGEMCPNFGIHYAGPAPNGSNSVGDGRYRIDVRLGRIACRHCGKSFKLMSNASIRPAARHFLSQSLPFADCPDERSPNHRLNPFEHYRPD